MISDIIKNIRKTYELSIAKKNPRRTNVLSTAVRSTSRERGAKKTSKEREKEAVPGDEQWVLALAMQMAVLVYFPLKRAPPQLQDRYGCYNGICTEYGPFDSEGNLWFWTSCLFEINLRWAV